MPHAGVAGIYTSQQIPEYLTLRLYFCVLALVRKEILTTNLKNIFIHVYMIVAWIHDIAVSLGLVLPCAPND